jgi:hypothetical protein
LLSIRGCHPRAVPDDDQDLAARERERHAGVRELVQQNRERSGDQQLEEAREGRFH